MNAVCKRLIGMLFAAIINKKAKLDMGIFDASESPDIGIFA